MNKSQILRLLLVIGVAGILIVSALPAYSFLSGPHSRLNDIGTIWLLLLSGVAAFISWVLIFCGIGVIGLIGYMLYGFIKNGPGKGSTESRGPG